MAQEPIIIINGKVITEAQARTIRVAVEGFDSSLALEGLGDDDQGKATAEFYRINIASIRRMIRQDKRSEPD